MGWPERLAAMEARVQNAERTVLCGTPADLTLLPEASGPLPSDLVGRARALQRATEAMVKRVTEARDDTARRLERLGSGHGQPLRLDRPRVVYIDTRA